MIICIEILECFIRFALHSKKNKEKISNIKKIDLEFNVENLEKISYELKQYLYENGVSTKKVFISIKTSYVITKIVSLPKMSEKDCSNAIKTNYKNHFPIDISEYKFDYRILYTDETSVKVLLAIIPNELSGNCLKILINSGLKPVFMDIYQDCICRGMVGEIRGENIVVIIKFIKNINIIFITNGEIEMIRVMPLRDNEKDIFELDRIIYSQCIQLDYVFLDSYVEWIFNYFFERGIAVSVCNDNESLIGLIK